MQRNELEIKRLHKRIIIRNILKPILVGFLIGRNAAERTLELRSKNDLVRKRIIENCDQVLECIRQQLNLILRSGTYLTYRYKEHCLKKITEL